MTGNLRVWHRRAACVLALATTLPIVACSDVRTTPDLPAHDVYQQIGEIDLSARSPTRGASAVSTSDGPPPRPASYFGRPDGTPAAVPDGVPGGPATTGTTPGTAGADGAAPAGAPGETFQLNFENAPIAAVVKATLGDILGVGYQIDPRVQGTVSLSFGRPLTRQQILFALENALRMSNTALLKDQTGYRIIPSIDTIGSVAASDPGSIEPGYGLTVLPLRNMTSSAMLKLLDGFATKPGAIRVDPARNLLLISGTAAERQTALSTALSFDVDWMRGQSVGIYPVRNGTPQAIIGELENIMQQPGEASDQKLVKFQPIDRLNAILVVSHRPEMLAKAETWINRLDRADTSSSAIKVYRVRYGDAKHIAEVLNSAFSGMAAPSDDSSSSTAPGSGQQTSRSSALGAFSQTAGSAAGGSNTGLGGGLGGQSQGGGGLGISNNSGGGGLGGSSSGSSSPFGTLGGSSFNATKTAATGSGDASGNGQGALSGVHVTADSVNNSLLIYASRENYKIVERTLRELDRPALQVAIEATIAEVTLNNALNYGVQYFLQTQDIGGHDVGSAGLSSGALANGLISSVLPGANLLLGPNANPRVVLSALRAYTDVKVVSSPSLVVLDNQVASLQVGDSVPVATSETSYVAGATSTSPTSSVAVPVSNSIDYRNTGVILRVLPRVNYNGNVSLDVEQEISSVVPSATAATLTPTVSERKIKSTIAVASGQTVMLAGLISDTQNNTRSGLPIVERLQSIGDLFSTNSRSHDRTELIIFIRPRIIRNGEDAAEVAEELRSKIMQSRDQRAPPPPAADAPPIVRRY